MSNNWMVAWNPAQGQWADSAAWRGTKPGDIAVGPWPDKTDWSRRYAMVDGCCHRRTYEMLVAGDVMPIFAMFHTLVVRDGIDPQVAHREFLKIDEYRYRIAPDIEGAEPEPEPEG